MSRQDVEASKVKNSTSANQEPPAACQASGPAEPAGESAADDLPKPDPNKGTIVLYTGPKLDTFAAVLKKLSFEPNNIGKKHLVDLLGRYTNGKIISHCEEGCRSKSQKCSKHNKKTTPCQGGLFKCKICLKRK